MKCPNCQASLKTITYEGIHIETCAGCGGEWLDAEELGHIARAREIRFSPEEWRAVTATAKITGVKIKDHDRDLKCPKCGGMTDAVNYGGDSGIIVDRCTSCHGIWLDKAELEGVQLLVEGWKDGLTGDLAKFAPKLKQVALEVDARTKVRISRFNFINAIINGILDLTV
jgi:Zn-finger nucleic acid-binding protein